MTPKTAAQSDPQPAESPPVKRPVGRPRGRSKPLWKAVKLPQTVVARMDELMKARGVSRARLVADALAALADPEQALQREAPPPKPVEQMNEDEFRTHLEAAVRDGGIGAMRLWSEMYATEEPPAEVDPFDQLREEKLKLIQGEAEVG